MKRAARHRPKPAQSPTRSPRTIGVVVRALVIVVAGIWAYSNSFTGVFVYDDWHSIVDNPHIRSIWPLSQSMTAPPEATVSGRPIVSLTLAINYAMAPADARDVMAPDSVGNGPGDADRFYRNVWGYHLLNLLIHLASALALFGIARRTLRSPALRERWEASADDVALAIAAIWVVHPLNTEAVTYVVQRAESLMGLFCFLTLYCSIRAIDSMKSASTGWTVAAICACALGMATKESMVTVPIVVALWAAMFDPAWRRRTVLFAGLAATWIVLVVLVVSEHRPSSVGFELGLPWWRYLATQAGVIVHYLRLAVWPSPLVFDYGWPPVRTWTEVVPQAIVLIGLASASVLLAVRRKALGFLGCAFFLSLAPTSSVLPIVTEIAAEHRMYVALSAVIAAIVLGGYVFLRTPPARILGLAIVGAIILGFGMETVDRNRVYASDERLWQDTAEKRPSNARARMAYGIALQAGQHFAEAEEQLRVAIALEPTSGKAHMNLGSSLAAQGRIEEGIPHLKEALQLDPDLNEAYGLLGEAYADRGDRARAIEYFSKAVQLMPNNPLLRARLAQLQQGR